MKKTALVMSIVSFSLFSCSSGENSDKGGVKQEVSEPDNKKNLVEKTFVYKEGDAEETIKMQFDKKELVVVNASLLVKGGQVHSISITEVEYIDDVDIYMAVGSADIWPEDVFVGFDQELTKLSLNDGKIKKVYYQQ